MICLFFCSILFFSNKAKLVLLFIYLCVSYSLFSVRPFSFNYIVFNFGCSFFFCSWLCFKCVWPVYFQMCGKWRFFSFFFFSLVKKRLNFFFKVLWEKARANEENKSNTRWKCMLVRWLACTPCDWLQCREVDTPPSSPMTITRTTSQSSSCFDFTFMISLA